MIGRHRITLLAVALTFSSLTLGQDKQPGDSGGPAPKLVIEATNHDFGEVKAGKPLTHTFKIKNRGTAELQIINVAPS